MRWREPPQAESTRGERWGSALAHGSALFIGLPLLLTMFPNNPAFALAPAPVVAYVIGRSFRKRGLAWGSFQGLQATLVHFLIVALAFLITLQTDQLSKLSATLWTAAALLFLYSLWGAFDTLLGYDFRYVYLGRLLRRVSEASIRRQERRREWNERERSGPPRADPPL